MITQLNATYVPLEDRVLFRFSTRDGAEYRLWLTRALVAGVLRACGDVAVKVAAAEHPVAYAKEISDFKQNAVAKATQFTEFKPAAVLPMGEVPVLVQGVNFTLEGAIFALAFSLVTHQTITLRLNDDLFAKFRLLLDAIEKKASWGLSLPASTNVIATADEQEVPINRPKAPSKILH
jgi:hypothetical protein